MFPRRVHLAACFATVLLATPQLLPGEIAWIAVDARENFPDAVEPGSIRHACSSDRQELEDLFVAAGLRFDPSLLGSRSSKRFCHVYYEPTVRGFRVEPANSPVKALYSAADAGGLLSEPRGRGVGLDVVDFLFRRLAAPVDTTLLVTEEISIEGKEATLARKDLFSKVRLQMVGDVDASPWAQDFIETGYADGRPILLIPRRIYQGRQEEGERYRPFLDALERQGAVRSKLAWDGGDLELAADPKTDGETILIHGLAAKKYWGAKLSQSEYAWVLKTELGASRALNVGKTAPHADYIISILPGAYTAFVAAEHVADLPLAREAADELVRMTGSRTPKAFAALAEALRKMDNLEAGLPILARRLNEAQQSVAHLETGVDPALEAALDAYLRRRCPNDPAACLSTDGKRALFLHDPRLFRLTLEAGLDAMIEELAVVRLLGLIEGQIDHGDCTTAATLDDIAERLGSFGYQVRRAPYLVNHTLAGRWPGVSYANLLAMESKLFVPTLGLGAAEQALVSRLNAAFPGSFEAVPVPARYALLTNGGAHCVFGIVREPLLGAPRRVTD